MSSYTDTVYDLSSKFDGTSLGYALVSLFEDYKAGNCAMDEIIMFTSFLDGEQNVCNHDDIINAVAKTPEPVDVGRYLSTYEGDQIRFDADCSTEAYLDDDNHIVFKDTSRDTSATLAIDTFLRALRSKREEAGLSVEHPNIPVSGPTMPWKAQEPTNPAGGALEAFRLAEGNHRAGHAIPMIVTAIENENEEKGYSVYHYDPFCDMDGNHFVWHPDKGWLKFEITG